MVWSEENLCPIGVVIWLGFAPARAHQRQRFGQAVAALYASHGGGADRPCLDPPGGAPVPRAAVAPASGGVSKQGGGKRHGEAA